jgi:hypothetical protein
LNIYGQRKQPSCVTRTININATLQGAPLVDQS